MRRIAQFELRSRPLIRVVVALVALALVVMATGCSEDTRDRIGDAVGERTDGDGGAPSDGGGQGDGGAPSDGGGQGDGGAPTDGGIIPEDGNDLAASDVLLLVLLGVVAVVAVLMVMHLGSTRQDRRAQARADDRARLAAIVGGVRWITDQASMEVMRLTDPRQLTASWHATRARCMDVERQIATIVASESRPDRRAALDLVGRACAGLRMALEADVALRTDAVAPDRPDLVTLSTQTVQQRRGELQYALADLERAAR